jgi:hypothetical protein
VPGRGRHAAGAGHADDERDLAAGLVDHGRDDLLAFAVGEIGCFAGIGRGY